MCFLKLQLDETVSLENLDKTISYFQVRSLYYCAISKEHTKVLSA